MLFGGDGQDVAALVAKAVAEKQAAAGGQGAASNVVSVPGRVPTDQGEADHVEGDPDAVMASHADAQTSEETERPAQQTPNDAGRGLENSGAASKEDLGGHPRRRTPRCHLRRQPRKRLPHLVPRRKSRDRLRP